MSKWNKAYNDKVMSSRSINFKNRQFTVKSDNMILVVYNVLNQLGQRLNYLESLIDKSFGDDIIGSALSYQQANLLRLVEMSEFFLIYARRLAIYIVSNEYEEIEKNPSTEKPFTKGDIKWLEMNMQAFLGILGIYSVDEENFIRAVKQIPDIQVPENKEELDLIQKSTRR